MPTSATETPSRATITVLAETEHLDDPATTFVSNDLGGVLEPSPTLR
jgi:hypothetical protein